MAHWSSPLPDKYSEYRGSVKNFFGDLSYSTCHRQAKYFLDCVYDDESTGARWRWSLDREFDPLLLEDHYYEMNHATMNLLKVWNEVVYEGKGVKRLRIEKIEENRYQLGIYSGAHMQKGVILSSGETLRIVLREFGSFGYGPRGKQLQRTY